MAAGRKRLETEIKRVQKEIAALGPLRPGSLYEHYSVCGKPWCRCARKKDPVKHGPYHYLSYTFQGKSHTEFVSRKHLPTVREQVRNYQRLMRLVKELVNYNIQLARWNKEKS